MKKASSFSYRQAFKKAQRVVNSRQDSQDLLNNVEKKSMGLKDRFGDLWDDFKTMLRLFKAWITREYDASWKLISSIAAVLVYFVMPIDAIPDFLLGFGLLDDMAIFAWAISRMQSELDIFRQWEAGTLPKQKRDPVVIEQE